MVNQRFAGQPLRLVKERILREMEDARSRIDSYLPKVGLAEPVERKFLKALKNSDIEALEFDLQLDEGVREGWISPDERRQLEELRVMTLDAISVDDFEPWELRSAGFGHAHGAADARAAA